MISSKLKKIFLLGLILIYAHGIEEIMFGFWEVDSIMMTWNDFLISIPQAVYYASHIAWWLLLIPIALLTMGGRWALWGLALFGIVWFIELHHISGAVFITHTYYPGMITAILYPAVGVFYYRELIQNFKKNLIHRQLTVS